MVTTMSDPRHARIGVPSLTGRATAKIASSGPPKIVLADDDHNIVDLLAELLEEEGYQVLRASNGQQAWHLCHEHCPDLVITDIMMPGMSGVELVARLRRVDTQRHTPVILMSAVPRTLREANVAFVPKPFDLDDMLDNVADSLDRKRDA